MNKFFMSSSFNKTTEDFTCLRCGTNVKGDGYTNHCPKCLWSRHVDKTPGDRQAACGGMMEPTALESKGGACVLTHRCTVCGHSKRNKTDPSDNLDSMLSSD